MKGPLTILLLLCATLSGLAKEEDFARYQLIIDKHPFGEEPPEAETTLVPFNESFAKDLRLSMLYEGPDGDVRAGVVDVANDKNYTLKIGESINSIELVEADIDAEEALLRKGSEVALFKLKPDDKPKIIPSSQQANRKNSYAERRKALLKKVEDQKKKEPAEPELTGEALRKHLEEVQMNAIRNGQPPLPIPLTPEMDAQLVSEGVLDPL